MRTITWRIYAAVGEVMVSEDASDADIEAMVRDDVQACVDWEWEEEEENAP